ncbi:MAG: beta-galactosidase, partial [Bacteroidales bacterium]|nr:beta-galactosidase [Bacteroidales bacterium]
MKRLIILTVACCFYLLSHAQTRLELRNNSTARIVANGKPMLMIGGELGNSSASTPDDVKHTFAYLHKMGLNTVLAPVSWELIEPQEGQFDLSSLDVILTEARRNELKVVLLWFGAWKNSMSCYTPEWFKRDTKRFPRAHALDGRPVEEASSLSKNVLEADKRAFCRIMEHLRTNDAEEQTVIMIQVENEIGMIDVPRDYSDDATKLYQSIVPQQLTDYLKKNQKSIHPYLREKLQPQPKENSNWAQMFGDDIYTEEIFQTWTYATYVEQIAKAGRAIYNLPMYVNVALNSRDRKPGQYPSGGPLAHLIDLWRCGAPSIDVLGVDIYDKGIKSWLSKYHLSNNPLFVPEIRLEDKDAMYALFAFGHHGAMGFCPFSIEDYPLYADVKDSDMSGMDLSQDDQLNAFSSSASTLSPLAASYQILRQAEPLILDRQGTSDMDAVLLDNEQREAEIITPDGIRLTIKHSYSLGWEPGAKNAEWPE